MTTHCNLKALELVDRLMSGVVAHTSSRCSKGKTVEEIHGWTLHIPSECHEAFSGFFDRSFWSITPSSSQKSVVCIVRSAQTVDHIGRACSQARTLYGFKAILRFLQCYLDVLCDSLPFNWDRLERDFPYEMVLPFLVSHMDILDKYGDVVLTKQLKFYTVAQSARFLDQEIPSSPVPGKGINPFTGRSRQAVSWLFEKKSERVRRFFNGVLQGIKRGCEPVPDSFVQSSRIDHIIALTKEAPTQPELLSKILDKAELLLKDFHIIDPLKVGEPSGSASYESSKKKGGLRGALLSKMDTPDFSLIRMYEERPGVVVEERASAGLDLKDLRDIMEKRGSEIRRETRDFGEWSGSMCRVAAVCEPLKVRLITAGDTVGQYACKKLQQDLWDYMQTIPSLVLTGRPMNTSDLYSLDDLTAKLGPQDFSSYISGDYSAATDNLHMDISRGILEMILRKYDPETYYLSSLPTLARSILLEQLIESDFGRIVGVDSHEDGGRLLTLDKSGRTVTLTKAVIGKYPSRISARGIDYILQDPKVLLQNLASETQTKKIRADAPVYIPASYMEAEPQSLTKENFKVVYLQTNGQLMGSVLSFPILCFANLCAYWVALENHLGRSIILRDLPVLVNGDDILFRADTKFYSFWKQIVAGCGFELSIGKNYFSSQYTMINSQLRYKRGGDHIFIPFLNCGLLTGQAKVTGRALWTPRSIDGFYNSVMDGCFDRIRTHKRFIYFNKADIASATRDGLFNLFVKPSLGGLGCRLYSEVRRAFDWYMTPFQEKLATYLYEQRYTEDTPETTKWLPILVGRLQTTEDSEQAEECCYKKYQPAPREVTHGSHLIELFGPLNYDQIELQPAPRIIPLTFSPRLVEPVKVTKTGRIDMSNREWRAFTTYKKKHSGVLPPKHCLFRGSERMVRNLPDLIAVTRPAYVPFDPVIEEPIAF